MAKDILKHEGAKISDVREVIDSRPAGVYANLTFMNRLEWFQPVRQRVVQGHSVHFCGHRKRVILSEALVRGKGCERRGFLRRASGFAAHLKTIVHRADQAKKRLVTASAA